MVDDDSAPAPAVTYTAQAPGDALSAPAPAVAYAASASAAEYEEPLLKVQRMMETPNARNSSALDFGTIVFLDAPSWSSASATDSTKIKFVLLVSGRTFVNGQLVAGSLFRVATP